MGRLFDVSGVGPLFPVVMAIVVVGVLVVVAMIRFGGRRVTGRSGDFEEIAAQLEAQTYANRGWGKPDGVPAWDGEDRLGLPRDLSENGM